MARVQSHGYIPTLDGWRAIAILGVLLCHLAKDADGPITSERLKAVFEHGTAGVDIFFGISGFLITTLLLREEDRERRVNLFRFYWRRVFRILPASWTYLAVVSAMVAIHWIAVPWTEIVAALALVRNYLPIGATHEASWYVGHFWSLNVEEHFYLLWPGLLCLLGRKRLVVAAPIIALSSGVWRGVCAKYPSIDPFPGTIVAFRTDARLDGLLWGCWFAILVHEPVMRDRLAGWVRPPIWLALIVGSVMLEFSAIPARGILLAVAIPLLLLGTVLHPRSLPGIVLEWTPLRWVGRISYSLYLWHIMFIVARRVNRTPHLRPWQNWPWNIIAVFVVASASYYAIERPLTRIGHRIAGRTGQASPAS